ncbi:MAG TPA: hypothetical protein PKD95_03740 [Candidatus Paceibacterota bacterium]|nr:hypothetical protein [Candidatus Paceibacterota bacterium]
MNRKKIIVGILAGAIAFYLISNFIVNKKLSSLEAKLKADIEEQVVIVGETAVLLGRGGASESVTNIIPECGSLEVARYDSLLSSLDRGLASAELQELKELFDRCGDTASVRRSIMTLNLSQEVKTLSILNDHYQSLWTVQVLESSVDEWNELVKLEQEISDNFNQLVRAQGNIIGALVLNTPSSPLTVENIRVEAESLRNRLTELTGQAAPLRLRLVKS